MAWLLRHRQTKGAETDRLGLRNAEPVLYSTLLFTMPAERHALDGEGIRDDVGEASGAKAGQGMLEVPDEQPEQESAP